nr:arabinosyltransferase C-terminal domain-containing protein [Actinomycetota bacterium]
GFATGAEGNGFAAGAGWRPDRPPPDPPGVRASAQVWGSRVDDDPTRTGVLVSPWFTLPALAGNQELALTVSGRTDQGNRLTVEFGRSRAGADPSPLGERVPTDQPRTEAANTGTTNTTNRPDPSLWRSVWLTPDQVPVGADRVRVVAVDGASDPDGWLALTGPRLREVVRLADYLNDAGPVLVNWPIAFLFPCVRDVVTVAHGVAAAPRTVLAPPRRYDGLGGQSTDPGVAGVFAAIHILGGLGEVPTRVAGHPDLDWGSLLLVDYHGAAMDGFHATLSRVEESGWSGDRAQIVTDGDRAGASRAHSP